MATADILLSASRPAEASAIFIDYLADADPFVRALAVRGLGRSNSPDATHYLAIALNAVGEREGAADQLLEVISANRNWNDGAARAQLLQFFEAWGMDDPATVTGRQKLSLLLFS